MTPARERGMALGALGLGALAALVAAGQPRVTGSGAGTMVSGADTPAATALALVTLAGAAVLLLVRPWARFVVGVLLAAIGLGMVAAFVNPVAEEFSYFGYEAGGQVIGPSAWAWLGGAGGLLVALGGAAVALRSRNWPTTGRRYDAPAARPRPTNPWDALDRGEDPTA